jgi:hypothetical protein
MSKLKSSTGLQCDVREVENGYVVSVGYRGPDGRYGVEYVAASVEELGALMRKLATAYMALPQAPCESCNA